MALFQKKPQVGTDLPLYNLGLHKTMLIVGLGNVGKEYDGTRHNIGFAVLDEFVRRTELREWVQKKDLKCLQATGTLGETRVIAIKPTTFMNKSGEAVQAVANFYKVPPDLVVVVHDELDIPFGQIRVRRGGSDAGNNGIKSVIQHLGEDFGRIRIGIKTETKLTDKDYVLARFSEDEQAQLPSLYKEAVAILTETIYGGQLMAETRSFLI
jgi:PTH1 family peptidyl-tRNA hydrolase